jgi:uncharacterized membrane protein YoaT (DUF817 family)
MKKILTEVLKHVMSLGIQYGALMLTIWLACVIINAISYRGYGFGEDTWKIILIANAILYVLRVIVTYVILPWLKKSTKKYEPHDSKKEISMEESA